MKNIVTQTTGILTLASALGACTATTSMQAPNSGAQLIVNDRPPITLSTETIQNYPTTSFGQFKFKLTKEGEEPMYGLVPLRFNGGALVTDIIFFAPAMFFNLREVFPFYEFDKENGVVRYKKKASAPWIEYRPTPAEIEHAKHFFGD